MNIIKKRLIKVSDKNLKRQVIDRLKKELDTRDVWDYENIIGFITDILYQSEHKHFLPTDLYTIVDDRDEDEDAERLVQDLIDANNCNNADELLDEFGRYEILLSDNNDKLVGADTIKELMDIFDSKYHFYDTIAEIILDKYGEEALTIDLSENGLLKQASIKNRKGLTRKTAKKWLTRKRRSLRNKISGKKTAVVRNDYLDIQHDICQLFGLELDGNFITTTLSPDDVLQKLEKYVNEQESNRLIYELRTDKKYKAGELDTNIRNHEVSASDYEYVVELQSSVATRIIYSDVCIDGHCIKSIRTEYDEFI